MRRDISSNDDIIDVRDIIQRVEELEDALENERELLADFDGKGDCPAKQTRLANIAALEEEIAPLASLLGELSGDGGDEQWRGDWYPLALIRESYFPAYARELLEDCGDIPKGLPHYIEIDWEATARNIKVDYSECEFDGTIYLYR